MDARGNRWNGGDTVNVETLSDLFVYELQGIHYLETQLGDAMEQLAGQSTVDSLDDRPDSELREPVRNLFDDHHERADERTERLDRAFDALDRLVDSREREVPAVDALFEEKDRFNNVLLNDALRSPFYLGVTVRADDLLVRSYESALDLADALDASGDVTDELEANRDDVEELLEDVRDVRESEAFESMLDEQAERSPQQ